MRRLVAALALVNAHCDLGALFLSFRVHLNKSGDKSLHSKLLPSMAYWIFFDLDVDYAALQGDGDGMGAIVRAEL